MQTWISTFMLRMQIVIDQRDGHVLVSYGFCNKLPQTWRLKITQIYYFKVLEVRSLKWTWISSG